MIALGPSGEAHSSLSSRRDVELGRRVDPMLHADFGRGDGCLMLALWFVTLMAATFVVTMLTVNL